MIRILLGGRASVTESGSNHSGTEPYNTGKEKSRLLCAI